MVGVVVGESAEEQVGEQVGAALLVGARIVGAEAAGRGGEHPVDGGGVGSRYFAGDIADAVGALHHGDAAFGQGAAMPLFERERLQPHHQPQQPDLELFRGSGVRGLNHLVVDGGQGGGFGDASRDPIDDPDLLGIHITPPERFPHGGQTCGESPGAGQQAAHLVGLIPQQQRQFVGHKLTRLRPLQVATIRNGCGSGFFGDPHIGVAHRRLGQPRRSRCGFPAGIRHRLPGRGSVMLVSIVLVIPRHAFIVAASH